ncbi:MAG: acetyltransferase [Planctomycetes bacterium]|nr:acetyltransferase [Planctomycetota bacterium]
MLKLKKAEKIVIVGAGDHARVVLDIYRELDQLKSIVGFIDVFDNPAMKDAEIEDFPVLGGTSALAGLLKKKVKTAIVCIGKNRDREKLVTEITAMGFTLVSAIHPSATISKKAEIGPGCMICAGSIVVTNAKLGTSVILNTGASVDHNCIISDFAQIAPGVRLAGRVNIGKGAMIGIGSSIKQGSTIGEYVTVGSGAAVVKDIPNNMTVVGVPAISKQEWEQQIEFLRTQGRNTLPQQQPQQAPPPQPQYSNNKPQDSQQDRQDRPYNKKPYKYYNKNNRYRTSGGYYEPKDRPQNGGYESSSPDTDRKRKDD